MQSSSFSLLFYLYSIPIHLKSKIQLPKYFYTHCEIHSVCKLRIYISIKFEYMLDVVSLLMVIKIRHRVNETQNLERPFFVRLLCNHPELLELYKLRQTEDPAATIHSNRHVKPRWSRRTRNPTRLKMKLGPRQKHRDVQKIGTRACISERVCRERGGERFLIRVHTRRSFIQKREASAQTSTSPTRAL